MAEFVEQRMEEMVSVFEKIQQTSLIPETQLKKVIGDIREHEMKIQRPARILEDFFNYFTFLKAFLDTLKASREEQNYHHHTIEIEDRLKSIIASRFGMANHNFKHDIRFWQFRLLFMKDLNCLGHVSNLFTEVTKVLGSKHPELWIDASRFEWTRYPGTSKGIDSARQFVQYGLRRHSNCLNLFAQGFILELQYVEFVLQNQEEKEKLLERENGEKILIELSLAKSFYNQAQKMCTDVGTRLYQVFYSNAKEFCEQILEDLLTKFSGDEAAYDILAKIALSEGKGKLFPVHIDNCAEKYEDGLLVRPTVKMYDLYLETFSYIVDNIPCPQKSEYEKRLLSLFERAHDRWKLSEPKYFKWFQMVKSIEDEGREFQSNYSSSDILDHGSKKFPKNSQFLHERIIQDIAEEDVNASQVYKKHKKNLQESNDSTLAIWSGLFVNVTLQPTEDLSLKAQECKKLVRDAPLNIGMKLGLLFIKYFGAVDMSIAREFYDENFHSSMGLEFHLEMAKLEATTLSDNDNRETILARISQCYENATDLYGQRKLEPWLTYIKFETERRNFTKASVLHSRALSQLSPRLKEQFILAERQLSGAV